jgi:hypothetical protein
VEPGIVNKVNNFFNRILPDSVAATLTSGITAPSTSGKQHTGHAASAEERAAINNQTGNKEGDFTSHEGHQHED